jgi:hypothetical protein
MGTGHGRILLLYVIPHVMATIILPATRSASTCWATRCATSSIRGCEAAPTRPRQPSRPRRGAVATQAATAEPAMARPATRNASR